MKLRIYCSIYGRLSSNGGDDFTNQLFLYRANSKLMSYAGTKDLRAVTTQRVRGSKITAERLAGLNKRFKGITLGNFEYVDSDIIYHFTRVYHLITYNHFSRMLSDTSIPR